MRCQECNYDLKGIGSDFCPECGAATLPMRLLTPDSAFETLVRVIGTWFAASAVITIIAVLLKGGTTPRGFSMTMTASMVPSAVIGVYMLLFAPQLKRVCYRGRAPRAYTPRALFQLVVGLVGVWLLARGLTEAGRTAVHELLSARPRASWDQVIGHMPRFIVGSILVISAGWLSRVWKD